MLFQVEIIWTHCANPSCAHPCPLQLKILNKCLGDKRLKKWGGRCPNVQEVLMHLKIFTHRVCLRPHVGYKYVLCLYIKCQEYKQHMSSPYIVSSKELRGKLLDQDGDGLDQTDHPQFPHWPTILAILTPLTPPLTTSTLTKMDVMLGQFCTFLEFR